MHKLHCVLLLFTLSPYFSFLYIFFYFPVASYIQYFGNSYLEFEGIELSAFNNITVRFQTQVTQGTILYVDQVPTNGGFFFLKLFILDGILQVKLKLYTVVIMHGYFSVL